MTTQPHNRMSGLTARVSRSPSLRGELNLPGDKSISHRAAMISALGSGVTKIENYSSAMDCQNTLDCLAGLGVVIEQHAQDRGSLIVHGSGNGSFSPPTTMLDAGNSGTTMRLLSGILAGLPFTSEIGGDESLHGGQCAVSSNRSKKWAQSLRLAMAGLPLFISPGQSPCDRLSTPYRERTGQIVRSPRRPVCRRYYYRHRAPSDPQSHRDHARTMRRSTHCDGNRQRIANIDQSFEHALCAR